MTIDYRELECGCDYSELRGAGSANFVRVVVSSDCTRPDHKKIMGYRPSKKKKRKRR